VASYEDKRYSLHLLIDLTESLCVSYFNPWFIEQYNFFCVLSTFCTHILKFFSEHFFFLKFASQSPLNTEFFIRVFSFLMQLHRMNYLKFFYNKKTVENRNMHEICIMIVPCNCCMLFELSC